MKSIILFLLVIFSFSSCKKQENFEEKITEVSLSPTQANQVKFVKPVVANSQEITKEIKTKIIKEGNLRFETSDLNTTYAQIQSALKSYSATIQNDIEGKDYGTIFRRLIIRVPSHNFDVFLNTISKGVTYFDNKEITSEDVTAEYIDIDARLKAKKMLENRYVELLKKANKVSEMLEIEAQLSAIREEIEAKQGQLNYLQNRVSFSTITIEFYKNVSPSSGATVSYGTKIWNAFMSGFNNFSSFFVGLISIWPFLIIICVLGYFIKKRFKKKTV